MDSRQTVQIGRHVLEMEADALKDLAKSLGDEYIQAVREEYERRRNLLVSGIQEIPGCKVSRPKGAFYFVVDFPIET